jgi:predicted  nucleic acid-binding Zn-ribbon protein
MNTTFKLLHLQKIDIESARIQNRLNEIDQILQDDSVTKAALLDLEFAKRNFTKISFA